MSGNHKLLTLVISCFFCLSCISSTHAQSTALKDSDMDGLTDEAETKIYQTDPNIFDTDGDGVEDGYEITNNTNPLDPQDTPYPHIEKVLVQNESIAWYIGRASGILAFILFSIVVMNGLLMTTRLVFKLLPPALNYEMHSFLAWLGLGTTMLHIISLTFDKYFQLHWIEAIIPFSVHRSFLSVPGFDLQWTLGIGSLAFYGIIMLIVSSKLKGKWLSVKTWRRLHYASFLTYLLFLSHGIFSGTDTKTWWMIWIYGISAFVVLGLIIMRIYISVKKISPKPTVTPDPAASFQPPA